MNNNQEHTTNKQPGGSVGDDAWCAATAATMEHHGFDVEQLPEIWQQVNEERRIRNGLYESSTAWNAQLAALRLWDEQVEYLLLRCETYTQYSQLTAILADLPENKRFRTDTHGKALVPQATAEQIAVALKNVRQRPEALATMQTLIMEHAVTVQITGPVVQRMAWDGLLPVAAVCSTRPRHKPGNYEAASNYEQTLRANYLQARHVIEIIQNELLGKNSQTWNAFLETVNNGDNIGDTAELAVTIEQQHRQ